MAIVSAPSPFKFFYDSNGNPLSGGKLYTYYSKTSVLRDTYKDAQGDGVNTNPVVLDANGGCVLFIDGDDSTDTEVSSGYRFVLFDAQGNLIATEDDIYAIKGKDGKNTGIIKYGPPGGQGQIGKSIRGPQGKKGDLGPAGKNGQETHFYREAGTYSIIVRDNVYSIDYVCGGAGGGILIENGNVVGNCGSGIAGKIVQGTMNVNPGDVLTITVGKKGISGIDLNAASGKSSSISGDTISTITASGGTAGNSVNLNSSQAYYDKMLPIFTETNFSGNIIRVIPDVVYGESTPYGTGGDYYKNGSADAVGNCASGGTSIPVFDSINNRLTVASFGNGGDGIVILSYVVNDES